MPRLPRLTLFALLFVTTLSRLALAQPAALDMLDTTKLPRLPGARELYGFPHTSSFVVRDGVAEAAAVVGKALAAEGWQEYVPPFSTRLKQPTMEIMTFKKGWQALSVYITVAPAQGGATAVAYTAIAIENDLPFPKDATDIQFAPERPHLNLFTAESVDATLAFFAKELGAMGWSPWSAKENAPKTPGEIVAEPTQRGAHAYFARDGKQPMLLVLQRTNDGRTMVELKASPLKAMTADTIARRGADHAPAPGTPAGTGAAVPTRPAAEMQALELPHLEGAREDSSSPDRVSYTVSGSLANTIAAARSLLTAHGWAPYVEPLAEPSRHSRTFMRGAQRLRVFFTTPGGRTDVTGVNYSLSRAHRSVPLPEGASDIVLDDTRPYLGAVAPGPVETLLEFFRKELSASGWSPWSATDYARYPEADIDETVENGVRAYFVRDRRERQEPIQVTVRRRADGRADVEVRVAPFARPKTLEAGSEMTGLPKPERIKSASGRDGRTRRELTATVPAELNTVLAFYRRELAQRGWKEEARDAVVSHDEVVLNFTSPDSTAVLKLGYQYDLTTVSLMQQLPDAVVAERARARREAEENLQRKAAEFLRGPTLKAGAAPSNAPIPVPETADNPTYDSRNGELKFDSASGVQAIAGFYRSAMKPLGFRENPTVIDNSNMVALDFSRGGKRLHITITQFTDQTKVRAYGAALAGGETIARSDAPGARRPGARETDRQASEPPMPETQVALEAEEKDGLPVPKPHTAHTTTKTQFRIESQTTVAATVPAVLAFYRAELAKRDWKEAATGAAVTAERAVVAFTAPEGPAQLTITRKDGKTDAVLALKKPRKAEQDGIRPKAGHAKVLIGSMLETAAEITIAKRTIKVAAGVGQKKPDGPTLDLRPGTYKYSVKVPGNPVVNEEVKLGADETWGVLVGPGGALALHVY